MNKALKQEINEIESAIAAETQFINNQNALLHDHKLPGAILPVIMAGSFVVGFAAARKKTLPELIKTSSLIWTRSRRLYRHIKMILPFLPI